MPNIEEIPVAYPASRDGLVQRTGPSTDNAPGERELFDHLNVWIPGPLMQDAEGASTVFGFLSTPEYMSYRSFVADLDTYTGYSFRRPRLWTDGNLTARIWYSGELTVDTQVIRGQLAFKLRQEGPGGDSTAFSEFGFDIDAPSADDDILIDRQPESDTTGAGYVVITSEHDLVTVRFARIGSHANDTYTEDFRLVGIEVFYRPRLVESTGLSPWLMKE